MPKGQETKNKEDIIGIKKDISGLNDQLKEVDGKVENIRDNHLAHIAEDITMVKTNQDWIMKFFWLVSGASVGSLVASIANLL